MFFEVQKYCFFGGGGHSEKSLVAYIKYNNYWFSVFYGVLSLIGNNKCVKAILIANFFLPSVRFCTFQKQQIIVVPRRQPPIKRTWLFY